MKNSREPFNRKNPQFVRINPVLCSAVPNSILMDAEISAGAKAAYAMLRHYLWPNDSCFPGQDRLAEDIGCTRVPVTRFVAELGKADWVTFQHRDDGRTDLYIVHRYRQKEVNRMY